MARWAELIELRDHPYFCRLRQYRHRRFQSKPANKPRRPLFEGSFKACLRANRLVDTRRTLEPITIATRRSPLGGNSFRQR